MFRFREFKVYQDAISYGKAIRCLSRSFPKEEQFGLTSQIVRASDSIALNIAEGSNRYTDKDFSRFLNQASSSVSEIISCLDIALENNYINEEDFHTYCESAEKIYKQLMAFSSRVRNSSKIK